MRKLALILLLVFPFTSFAETYKCDVDNSDQTIVFEFVSELPNEDGWDRVAKFKLMLYTANPFTKIHSEYGVAKTGDTYFYYTSLTSDIEFGMYLDEEAEKVRFKLNGEEKSFSNCRW